MKLGQIFAKPVDRPIEGVIKADDESGLLTEIEEYVLTNEVAKRLEHFLEAYNNYQGANGAWVSGFFGSGKSHLLKILALLLENRPIDGVPVLERFLPKCDDNALLKANLNKAVAIPSKSILFNIDQKADVISKTQVDALLAVFVKVFDEMCGYYGKQGYIASFERDLDKRGLYADFKTAFGEIAGLSWERGREQALLEAENIAAAYARVAGGSGEAVNGILDKYRAQYKVSIEDFALQVNEYIEGQGRNFRLNFFVDEVGQYIADNVKLMTNLQTIAESLATKCRGRAWIIVTAQEDMDNVIGEMNARQANDFSKIQARFATKMKLTSQNVAEVIQKRLLAKNEAGKTLVDGIYREQANNFGTLFDFADGSQTYRNFRDQAHFASSYPFIPYQFNLFQTCIQDLSQHSAFEGKHSSVGERSMLAVFQQVAIHIAEAPVGGLATFDLMFEGIRNALKTQIQAAVISAERNLDNQFSLRVLKALFLVKYVKGFKATVHNITVLMTDRFGGDLPWLRREVEEALNLLEQQTYIQRNGDLYEFLTNEEKDVEEEIKNTEVDADAISAELAKVIFDQIIRDRKIRFDDNRQDFPFARKLDEQLIGRDAEIAIHIISPFHEHFDNEETVRMHAMGRDELLVVLPADNRLVQDLLMYKRTDKYVQQNVSVAQQEAIHRILMEKSHQNRERLKQVETRARDLIVRARMFLGNTALEITSTEPQTRIIKAFQELIRRTYPNLRMLHNVEYSEGMIDSSLHQPETLFGTDNSLNEAEQEMLAFIQGNKNGGVRTTLKALDDRFERKPYGWSLAAIQCNLALLAGHGKVELRKDSNLLENAALVSALRNTQAFINVVIDPQVDFSPAQVRRLKEFYEDFFDMPPQANEARELARDAGTKLKEQMDKLKGLTANQSLYPFLAELNDPISRLQDLVGKPYAFYLTDLPREMDALLDQKEQTIAPVLSFWNGEQKRLYDEARRFQQEQSPNFDYIDGEDVPQLRALLTDAQIFKGNKMQLVRARMEAIRQRLGQALEQQKQESGRKVREVQARLEGMADFVALKPAQKQVLSSQFSGVESQLQLQTLIARVNDIERSFIEREYPQILARMEALVRQAQADNAPATDAPRAAEPRVEYVSSRGIHVEFGKAWLADESDVDAYLSAWREALMKEVAKNKRIQI